MSSAERVQLASGHDGSSQEMRTIAWSCDRFIDQQVARLTAGRRFGTTPETPEELALAKADSGRVYFARSASGLIKIGYSKNVERRLASLRTGHPSLELLLVLPGGRRLERKLHQCFSAHRVGGEWFSPNKALELLIAHPESSPILSWEESYPEPRHQKIGRIMSKDRRETDECGEAERKMRKAELQELIGLYHGGKRELARTIRVCESTLRGWAHPGMEARFPPSWALAQIRELVANQSPVSP